MPFVDRDESLKLLLRFIVVALGLVDLRQVPIGTVSSAVFWEQSFRPFQIRQSLIEFIFSEERYPHCELGQKVLGSFFSSPL